MLKCDVEDDSPGDVGDQSSRLQVLQQLGIEVKVATRWPAQRPWFQMSEVASGMSTRQHASLSGRTETNETGFRGKDRSPNDSATSLGSSKIASGGQ